MPRISVLSLLFIGLSVISLAPCAHAQDASVSVPGFAIPQIITNEEVANLGVDFDDAFNTIENLFLSDTIKLNYQISLLEKLVARQAQVEKISESYSALGLSFDEPPPPRGICAQLPANAPCLKSYPDLYSALVADRKAHFEEIEAKKHANRPGRKAGESDKQAEARAKKEAAEKAAKAAAAERKVRYRWTEVTCLSGQCHGVLIKSAAANYRVTVRNGSKLADGTIVQNVSSDGIRVSIDGDVIAVRPAPGDGDGETAGQDATSPLENALKNAGVSAAGDAPPVENNPQMDASRSAAASAIANAQQGSVTPPTPAQGGGAGSSGQSTGEAPLGPSGLF
jgi:hypothetical protein